ncbi:hypothetical protein E1295_14210 [Nonomuraea mesophila]|uniref:Uncharacterized protein n=1 Tax=Nonomuraea mesophila TaxID=2530382 RepID=A0A4R5FPT6_9ACTN|nr:hypothetical protein [Nonomuraea mesophila]TDE54678.1 hypothetical protein E1295_14210 [Nonomuraea mesophila]
MAKTWRERPAACGDDRPGVHGAPHTTGSRSPGTPKPDEGPTYGRGSGGRPLWSERDRDAERIGAVLRRSGCAATGGGDGFAVEGGHDGVFLVTFAERHLPAAGGMEACVRALVRAGMSAEPQPGDARTLRVRTRPIG